MTSSDAVTESRLKPSFPFGIGTQNKGTNKKPKGVNLGQLKEAFSYGKEIEFFEGVLEGEIVKPQGDNFGWDPIFKPHNSDKTLALMSLEERNKIKMRGQALRKLREFINK